MRRITLRFQIIVYPSEARDVGAFTAHCLNLDIVAAADSVEGALDKMLEAIEEKLDAAEEHGVNPIQIAPREYWDRLGSAIPIPPELKDRIVGNANKRNGVPTKRLDSDQLEIRELQPA